MDLRWLSNSKSLYKSLIHLHNPNSRNVHNLAYKCYGTPKGAYSGQVPVIILHDFLGSKKNWDHYVTSELAASLEMPVIALDARNHGESPYDSVMDYHSMARDVNNFIERHVDTKEAMLIGQGMGGKTAMYLALSEPSRRRVLNLIVIDQSPISKVSRDRERKKKYLRILDAMQSIKFGAKDIDGGISEAKYWLEKSGLASDDKTIRFILSNVGKKKDKSIGWMCNVPVLMERIDNIMGSPFGTHIGNKYEGPTMFIAGTKSNELHEKEKRKIQDVFPSATLNFIEDAGHNPHTDFPELFLDTVRSFNKEHPIKLT